MYNHKVLGISTLCVHIMGNSPGKQNIAIGVDWESGKVWEGSENLESRENWLFLQARCVRMPDERTLCRRASLLCITPSKMYYHLRFFNLPGLQKPRRNRYSDKSCWDTYEWKQTKIWMIFKLKSGGVLILKCVVLFYFNHNLVICF